MNELVLKSDAELVWGFLSTHHRGAAHAVKEKDLALAAGLRTTRELQQLLEYLVNAEHRPIVASCRRPFGVFVAVTEQEKAEYLAQLKNRIIGLARRMRGVKHSRLFEEPHQAELFYGNPRREAV